MPDAWKHLLNVNKQNQENVVATSFYKAIVSCHKKWVQFYAFHPERRNIGK